ncbi:MAG: glycosyltransferase family 2 protein [Candidatus Peregrinibacteria bacterium]
MLSLILPTYNEAENLPELLPNVEKALAGIPFEVIVVDDDSPDETWKVALALSQDRPFLHVIRRVGRRGLSSAVIEGFLAAKGDTFAVMDADGQHDSGLLRTLADATTSGSDLAVGSRYVSGGSIGEWDERRHLLSRIATRMGQMVCRVKISDPMSGFFALRRSLFESVRSSLNPKGFKILLDLLVHIPKETRVTEHPFTFKGRMHGASKMSRKVQIEFLEYLYDVTAGKYISLTFVKYCIVGLSGVVVNVAAYWLYASLLGVRSEEQFLGFSIAVVASIETAVLNNFLWNNLWTFAHKRLRGRGLVWGFLTFNAACAVGALVNYAASAFLVLKGLSDLLAVTIGAFTAVLWNYVMNKMFTWRD